MFRQGMGTVFCRAVLLGQARVCKQLKSPGIDSEEWIPPAYVARRPGTTNRVVVLARQAGNRFLGSLKGLLIRALEFLNNLWRPRTK